MFYWPVALYPLIIDGIRMMCGFAVVAAGILGALIVSLLWSRRFPTWWGVAANGAGVLASLLALGMAGVVGLTKLEFGTEAPLAHTVQYEHTLYQMTIYSDPGEESTDFRVFGCESSGWVCRLVASANVSRLRRGYLQTTDQGVELVVESIPILRLTEHGWRCVPNKDFMFACKVGDAPNERMQLTWLLGAPSRPVSVHQLVVGRGGLGSAATQLMRAVGRSHGSCD